MLKVCYVAFSIEVLPLNPIALLLMLYRRSARLLDGTTFEKLCSWLVASAETCTLVMRQYSETTVCLQLLLL